MANYQEIMRTVVQGLSNQKRTLDDLNIELEAVKKELGDFEGEYSKEVRILNDRIDAINVQIDKTIKEAIAQLPKQITPDEINELISSQLTSLETKEDEFKTFITDYLVKAIAVVQSKVKDGKDGVDGKDGKDTTPKQIANSVEAWINENIDLLKGEDGKDGKDGKSIQGKSGKDGSDGVGIVNIERSKDDLLITLTDGSEKRFKLPRVSVGGGGVSEQVATSVRIISTDKDIELNAMSQNVLVDATNGNVTVKLPNPKACYFQQRSYKIGITRIDNTANSVNIIPFDSETILNETSQDLFYNEVLNLITDQINWWYGA